MSALTRLRMTTVLIGLLFPPLNAHAEILTEYGFAIDVNGGTVGDYIGWRYVKEPEEKSSYGLKLGYYNLQGYTSDGDFGLLSSFFQEDRINYNPYFLTMYRASVIKSFNPDFLKSKFSFDLGVDYIRRHTSTWELEIHMPTLFSGPVYSPHKRYYENTLGASAAVRFEALNTEKIKLEFFSELYGAAISGVGGYINGISMRISL